MSLQGHEAVFRLKRNTVRVTQDTTKVDGLGGEVWAGAYVLCEFLETHEAWVQGRNVLELGAGCGLCGLVSAALGARRVVLTDEYPDLLELNITKNAELWTGNDNASVASGMLEWGEQESMTPFLGKFDLVLGSEITQLGRDLHRPLLETVRGVMAPGNADVVALLSMDPCRASCAADCDVRKCTASHFAETARNVGFSVTEHASVRLVSSAAVTSAVGALGRPLPVDEDDWSTVFELRLPIE